MGWNAAGIHDPSGVSCTVSAPAHTHTHTHTRTKILLSAVFQCDQQSPGAEAGGGDPDVVAEAHRQHCGHLLRLLHYLRHLGSTGENEKGEGRRGEERRGEGRRGEDADGRNEKTKKDEEECLNSIVAFFYCAVTV